MRDKRECAKGLVPAIHIRAGKIAIDPAHGRLAKARDLVKNVAGNVGPDIIRINQNGEQASLCIAVLVGCHA